jgi:hypothetical protein
MNVMNGNMLNRDINEISILFGLKKLNWCEKEGLIKDGKKIRDDKKEEFRKDFDELLNMYEYVMMNMNGLEMMDSSEVEKLKIEIDGLLKEYKLGVILRSKLGNLREEVKEIMWSYFKKNRLNLSVDISDFREDIIVDLMKGCDVKEVFELYGGVGMLKAG